DNERLEVERDSSKVLLKDVIAREDQLKAENERLAAACEKAEQIINAESKAAAIATGRGNLLQAESEALRKALSECADSLHGEMLQKFGGQLPEDMHPVTRRDYDRDMAEIAGYRAALSKGEQP
ncbi:hypothetical protein ACIOWK_34995, partial [Pseudomonas protegens]|uniref:hypothetical protein n=1 Tax=Pseudomonas protegens TaxID=380021 RepID=UPI0038018EDF